MEKGHSIAAKWLCQHSPTLIHFNVQVLAVSYIHLCSGLNCNQPCVNQSDRNVTEHGIRSSAATSFSRWVVPALSPPDFTQEAFHFLSICMTAVHLQKCYFYFGYFLFGFCL
ncbi:hypothetical protein XENTR_v10000964 [Xenopus tropicalis]|nr:hypothetical protein XENTR_v10000964 [Xenopus tropicalis]